MNMNKFTNLAVEICAFKAEWNQSVATVCRGLEAAQITYGGFNTSDMLRDMYKALDADKPRHVEFQIKNWGGASRIQSRPVIDCYNLDVVLASALEELTMIANGIGKQPEEKWSHAERDIIWSVGELNRMVNGTLTISSTSRQPVKMKMVHRWNGKFLSLSLAVRAPA